MEQSERIAPYTSWSTFKTFIQELHEQGLPARIDRSVWQHRFSGSVGPQVVTALRFFGLIDQASEPTSDLKSLVKAYGTDQFPSTLREILKRGYGSLLQLDFKTITSKMLDEKFDEQYKAKDDVQRKSKAFFLHAAKDAGIELGGRIANKTRGPRKKGINGSASQKRSEAKGNAIKHHDGDGFTGLIQKTALQVLYEILDPNDMDEPEQQAVWTLIRYLKKKETANA